MRNKVVGAVLGASLGWGLAGVGTRAAYGAGAGTVAVLGIRSVVATVALVVAAVALSARPSRQAWTHGAAIGALRIGLAPYLFMMSLNYISAGVEGLIITLVPATTAALAALFIGERIHTRQLVGLAIGLAGTMIIALAGESGLGAEGDIVLGTAFAGAGVIVGSSTGVMQRHYAPRYDTVDLAVPLFVSGTVVAIVIGSFVGFGAVGGFDMSLWVLLIVLGLGATLAPFALTLYASKHASATVVAMTAYLAPMVAVIGGAILLDEQVTPVIVVGGALAVVGVALVGSARRTQT